ncbi:MAG: precorrin-6y C5,15-methyltransferase (decarboxylating) subunit CbiE, partial [Gammaproteobacteria bacterium]
MAEPCRIIGVLEDGTHSLCAAARGHLSAADLVIGTQRTLSLIGDCLPTHTVRRDLTGRLSEVPGWIDAARTAAQRTVVVATGDPLCHGIGEYLIERLGSASCEIIPNVSTIQLACARLGIPWHRMRIASVHGQDAGEWVPGAGPEHALYALLVTLAHYERVAVLTSAHNTPDRIARLLVAEGWSTTHTLTVAERLASSQERIVGPLSPSEAASRSFAAPNVVLLCRHVPRAHRVMFGLADESFAQRKPNQGLITKREVRAVSLAYLGLRRNSIVWDIGAGSGAVGLEAAQVCSQGHVYAAEKNAADVAIAWGNRRQCGIHNYTLLHTEAPAGLDTWPDPHGIFIGGSGGRLSEVIAYGLGRLQVGGSMVMNLVTLENLWLAITTLQTLRTPWRVTQIQVARSHPIQHNHRFVPENPVWILTADKDRPWSLFRQGRSSEHPFGAQAFGSRTPGAQGCVRQGCRTQADRDVFTASL